MAFDSTTFSSDTNKVFSVVAMDLSSVKTGRAKPSLVENIMVEAYGTRMKMIEVANVTAPDISQLVIAPWDKSLVAAVEKAISSSDLNIHPVVDGEQIRIMIPPLTQERREEMVRVVKQKIESGKTMIRDVRQKYKKMIEDQKGQPGVSEDAIKRELEDLQKRTDASTAKLEELGLQKEHELMAM